MRKVLQLILQTILKSTINYLTLAIFQQMPNLGSINCVNSIVKV